MATIPSGFPTAETTGVPAGTTLTTYNGTLVVTQDNTVISGVRFTGNVVINAQNVTMVNCVIDTTTPYHAILIPDGYTGFTLRNSEINGNGQTVNAISGSGTFLNNDIKGVENGINIYGASVIENNFIHDMAGGPNSHFDGIENNGASNVQIIHNTIINDYDQTSAVMLNNEFGSLRNITIDDNYLVGGGYTVYLDGRKGGGAVDDASIRITNNQIVEGHWGPFAFYDDHPVQTGNVVNDAPASPDTGDATLSIAALSADKVEGQSGSAAFTFTVTHGGDTSVATSASWAVTGSGANPASASDFVGAVFPSGTVNFAAGETSKTITVNVAGDTVVEPNEGFTVTLSNPAASTTIGTATASGTIRNDDASQGDRRWRHHLRHHWGGHTRGHRRGRYDGRPRGQ